MATYVLPFLDENEEETDGMQSNGDIYPRLPDAFRDVVENNPHLLDYLNMLPVSQIGIPEFHSELSKDMGDIKDPNIIYPVANGLFTHILVDHKDSRNHYIQIEPTLTENIDRLMESVEEACITSADRLPLFDMEGDRETQLLDYIDCVTTHEKHVETEPGTLGKIIRKFRKNTGRISKVSLTEPVSYTHLRAHET